MGEEKSFSQRAFSIYTDIRKLQDKAKTSYMSQTAYIVWKGGADEILDQLHFIRVEAQVPRPCHIVAVFLPE